MSLFLNITISNQSTLFMKPLNGGPPRRNNLLPGVNLFPSTRPFIFGRTWFLLIASPGLVVLTGLQFYLFGAFLVRRASVVGDKSYSERYSTGVWGLSEGVAERSACSLPGCSRGIYSVEGVVEDYKV